jgi:hypothetical protein
MYLLDETIWKPTKASDFCFKCIAGKHGICRGKCECLCNGM